MTKESQIPQASLIFEAIYAETGVPADQIMGRRRTSRISEARHMVIAILHIRFPDWSLQDLSDAVKRKDHGSSIYALRKVRKLVKTSIDYKKKMQRILAKINN
jgi:chromosomal replication initiation ATPase DnaA